MNSNIMIVVAMILAGAVGFWLVLPAGRQEPVPMARRFAGLLLLIIALGLILARTTPLGYWLVDSMFYILATATIGSAAAMVAMRKPVYAALWFGMTLLGTAGLFLFQGAQFLAVATIVVYAGAILVTYLFVLILAQPKGRAPYDRTSTEPLLAATVGLILIGFLTMTIDVKIQWLANREAAAKEKVVGQEHAEEPIGRLGFTPDPELQKEILTDRHVARLGTELFAKHLVAVEVAGLLLFVALVGATAVSREVSMKREE